MAINLVTKFQPYTDEQFSTESKKALVTNQDLTWTGAHTIKVYKVTTSGMGDRAAVYGIEFDDLYNSGYLALVSAVELYNPEPGMRFIGLLALCLKTAFAETRGWRTSKRDPLNNSTSMDKPVGEDDDGGTMGDFIPDPSAAQAFQDVEERLYQEQLHAALERALGTLEADEEAAIRARYYQGRTREEIGPHARTLESHALVKLRRSRVRRELEQYIEWRTPYYMSVGVQAFQNTNESAVERIVFLREQMRGRKGLAV